MIRNKKVLKAVKNAAIDLLILLIVAYCAALAYTHACGKLLYLGGKTLLYVKTGSMEPDIPSGSFIVVEKVDPDTVSVGDVITFVSEDEEIRGKFNTHEVIEVIGDHEAFRTKGTHNPAPDELPTKKENVAGRYVRNADRINAALNWFLTETGLICTLALILVVCIGVYLPSVIRSFLPPPEKKDDPFAEIAEILGSSDKQDKN